MAFYFMEQAVASGQAWMPGPVQVKNLGTYLYKESSYTGPLMGGGASSKDLNKWIEDRVSTYQPYDSSRLLLGLLKVACQHYGKLRSLNGTASNSSMVWFVSLLYCKKPLVLDQLIWLRSVEFGHFLYIYLVPYDMIKDLKWILLHLTTCEKDLEFEQGCMVCRRKMDQRQHWPSFLQALQGIKVHTQEGCIGAH